MESSKAKQFILLRREGNEPSLDGYVNVIGTGDEYPISHVQQLYKELFLIKENYPVELKQRDEKGGKFEAEACAIVHKFLKFNPQVFSDSGFWIWLAVTQLSAIVEWRHGGADRPAALANYGIGNRIENLIFRMWLRAELVFDQTANDPYWLAKRGDQDLWRSHILRQNYANVRELTKTLIKFQCQPDGNRLGTEGIRELAKRIRRLRANIMFEFLNTDQLMMLLTQQSNGLTVTGSPQ